MTEDRKNIIWLILSEDPGSYCDCYHSSRIEQQG
jgi:hypothetical protein